MFLRLFTFLSCVLCFFRCFISFLKKKLWIFFFCIRFRFNQQFADHSWDHDRFFFSFSVMSKHITMKKRKVNYSGFFVHGSQLWILLLGNLDQFFCFFFLLFFCIEKDSLGMELLASFFLLCREINAYVLFEFDIRYCVERNQKKRIIRSKSLVFVWEVKKNHKTWLDS